MIENEAEARSSEQTKILQNFSTRVFHPDANHPKRAVDRARYLISPLLSVGC
jgi:hypothetical protein